MMTKGRKRVAEEGDTREKKRKSQIEERDAQLEASESNQIIHLQQQIGNRAVQRYIVGQVGESMEGAREDIQEGPEGSPIVRERRLLFQLPFPDSYDQFRQSMETGIGLRMRYRGDQGRAVHTYLEESSLEEAIFPGFVRAGVSPGEMVDVDVLLGLNENGTVRRLRFTTTVGEVSFSDEIVGRPRSGGTSPTAGSGVTPGEGTGMTGYDYAQIGAEAVGVISSPVGAIISIPAGLIGGLYTIGDLENVRQAEGIASGYADALVAYRAQARRDQSIRRAPRLTRESLTVDTDLARQGWRRAVEHIQPIRRADPETFFGWMIELGDTRHALIVEAIMGDNRYRDRVR